MRPTQIILASFIFLSLVNVPASSQELQENWQVVRLSNQRHYKLKCYQQLGVNAPVIVEFSNGEFVKTREQKGAFIRVVNTTRRETIKTINCWVSKKFVSSLPPRIQGKIYPGTYRYVGTQPLPCRQAAGNTMPTTGFALLPDAEIKVASVALDDRAQTWFRINCGSCYIPASDQLLWAGKYEDPNTMCDYLRQTC